MKVAPLQAIKKGPLLESLDPPIDKRLLPDLRLMRESDENLLSFPLSNCVLVKEVFQSLLLEAK